MTQERVAVLEKMGFDFTPLDSGLSQRNREVKTQEQWEAKFNDLLEYREKNGDCLVSCLAEETVSCSRNVCFCIMDVFDILTMHPRFCTMDVFDILTMHPHHLHHPTHAPTRSLVTGFVDNANSTTELVGMDFPPNV